MTPFAALLAAALCGADDAPIGWASCEGGTRGGAGGMTAEVRDAASFTKAVSSDDPLIVHVIGEIKLNATLRVKPNKTILGQGADAALVGGGLHLRNSSQVIVRNLSLRDSPDDAINIEGSHHVWIDHCDLSRCRDGLLDVKAASDFVTVSWNRFHDHEKTCLLGHSDNPAVLAKDKGHLRVTYHHNFFDGSKTRHPRVRIAETVHVFNNYYRDCDYGVASVTDAGVLVEGNFFERVKNPTHTLYGDSKAPGRLVERHNASLESGPLATRGEVREVRDSYAYVLDDAQKVRDLGRAGAGVGKLGY
jgi:pectate lyase